MLAQEHAVPPIHCRQFFDKLSDLLIEDGIYGIESMCRLAKL